MAVTSIWSVRGWLGKVLHYAENPKKTLDTETAEQGLADVIAYAVNEEKTRRKRKTGRKYSGGTKESRDTESAGIQRQDGDVTDAKELTNETKELADENEPLMQQYVSGINCTLATARMEMAAVKKRYGKNDGIMAFHGYQSFAPGECTPAMAHEIGVRLAEELWGSRFQVLVATHLDKAHHLHNHFVVNSVSFRDGLRYHRTSQDYRDMREASDRLCREYGLSVVEKETGRAKHYSEWRAQQEGKPTYKGLVREDVEDAIRKARTEKQFYHYLKEKGYDIKFGKDITVRPAGRERGLKLARNFGEEYTIEAIRRRILMQAKTVQNNENIELDAGRDTPEGRKNAYVVKESGNPRRRKYTVRAFVSPGRRKKNRGLRGLYLRYCYLLGILPGNRNQRPPCEVSPLLREDLIRLNTISKETRLLCHYRIDTAEQLFSLKEGLQVQMKELAGRRKALRSRSRSIRDGEDLSKVKTEIAGLTKEIGVCRKELALCEGIAVRSVAIKEKLETIQREQEKIKAKEEKEHEHIRRSR